MSADYYRREQHGFESFAEPTSKTETQRSTDSGKKANDIRLQDIEEQLEMAESRCNNLKDQLDYMKQMYGGTKVVPPKSRKISSVKDSSAVNLDEPICKEDNLKIIPVASGISRQQSNAIETDNSGEAVKTINNILNGITNSVNRLSEIHSQIATPRPKMSTGVSPRTGSQEEFKTFNKDVLVIPEIKIESASALACKPRGQKRKARSGKTFSQLTIKKASRIDKKLKSAVSKSSAISEKQSSTIVRNRYLNRLNMKNNHLVEIYHNDAIKNSDSDESNLKKSRQQNERKCEEEFKETGRVPPLNMQMLTLSDEAPNLQTDPIDQTYQNGLSTQYCYDPPHAPRTTVSCCYSKNYELPTVASKMKQVAKSYLGNLNLKTIPFCAAISTTQSHNIGINIQQVMNIIKNRQPINGISPTLAHNIGLAAEKLNSKPFSTLISTINSKIGHTASRCPLSRTYLNLQQLQEQAKTIPEETIEEAEEDSAESPQIKTMIITGPSGDMEVRTKNAPLWSIDKSYTSEQCTCVAQATVNFQHVDRRYPRSNRTVTENTINSNQILENRLKSRLRRYKTTKQQYLMKNATSPQNQVQTIHPVSTAPAMQEGNTLQGREKNLKEVLSNLHSDFEALNRRYEELSEKSQGGNEEAIKELERLEAELSKKEEEITMVMALYKEVIALKQQVKQLKERRSQASLPPKSAKSKFEEYNNPEAAFHLTKLLRQIQHYQMRYKSNLSEN